MYRNGLTGTWCRWNGKCPADGGWRRILRGTVTREPGKGVFRQDGRRVFERGATERPARVSRTNPFPRPRPPFPAMEPPPSVCRLLSVALRQMLSVSCSPSAAFCLLPSVRRPPSAALRLPPPPFVNRSMSSYGNAWRINR